MRKASAVLTNTHDVAPTIGGHPPTIGSIAMTEMTMRLEQNEENLLTYEVSDEALESAGGREIAGNFTLGACTGLSVCDG